MWGLWLAPGVNVNHLDSEKLFIVDEKDTSIHEEEDSNDEQDGV